jgi:hypothetical protein
LEPFKLDFVNLVENSLSVNTWNVYANAEKSFEKFSGTVSNIIHFHFKTNSCYIRFGSIWRVGIFCQINNKVY